MSRYEPITTKTFDQLVVKVFKNRYEMGVTAGTEIARKMKELLLQKEEIRMIFAAAPSQSEMLSYLAAEEELDWSRVVVFHMDEYIGLPRNAPQRFSAFLREKLFDKVKPKHVHLINGTAPVEQECERYETLLRKAPIDIVCLGIGENGHIAFNDPPVAKFDDLQTIKRVLLDEKCRQQQVNDGCFASIDEVPEEAVTLTIPALLSANYLYCVVPGKAKKEAVYHTLNDDVTTEWPASILRTHANCTLYLDQESYGETVDDE